MSVAVPELRPASAWVQPGRLAWAAGLAAVALLMVFKDLAPWAVKYPKVMVVPLRFWVSDFMKWLVKEADLGLFTFKEFTRSIAWLLDWFLATANGLLAEGFRIPLGEEAFFQIPPVSWIGLVAVVSLLAFWVRDLGLALLVGLCFGYLAVFGQWDSAMVTLSSIVVAVPLGVLGGLMLGILAHRHPWFEKTISPILDLMQTVPVFAYLVPILFLFGFGPVAAMIATMIYAMPPMVRCAMLALEHVPTEVTEFGRIVDAIGDGLDLQSQQRQ